MATCGIEGLRSADVSKARSQQSRKIIVAATL